MSMPRFYSFRCLGRIRPAVTLTVFFALLARPDRAFTSMRGPPLEQLASGDCETMGDKRANTKLSNTRIVANWLFSVYRKGIRPARGGLCPMHPSCSAYAELSWGMRPFPGSLLRTTDRLMRCGADTQMYRGVLIDGNYYSDDSSQ